MHPHTDRLFGFFPSSSSCTPQTKIKKATKTKEHHDNSDKVGRGAGRWELSPPHGQTVRQGHAKEQNQERQERSKRRKGQNKRAKGWRKFRFMYDPSPMRESLHLLPTPHSDYTFHLCSLCPFLFVHPCAPVWLHVFV
mmetsp:Transcript_360/g.821  ORF Transcript_360/g.821 Transcript_360/m.821 type:complete len:138 (+) Transcript_360:52-465(+)